MGPISRQMKMSVPSDTLQDTTGRIANKCSLFDSLVNNPRMVHCSQPGILALVDALVFYYDLRRHIFHAFIVIKTLKSNIWNVKSHSLTVVPPPHLPICVHGNACEFEMSAHLVMTDVSIPIHRSFCTPCFVRECIRSSQNINNFF